MSNELNCDQLKQLINQGAQLIDVRTSTEFNQGSLNGAMNMPLEMFEYLSKSIDELKPVLLYCRSGMRSGMAKNYLEAKGHQEVYNIGSYERLATCC